MRWHIRATVDGLRLWILAGVNRIRRTQPGPALLRTVAALAAAVALAAAAPSSVLHSSQIGLFMPFAIGVGLYPRTRFVTVTAMITLLLWLLNTFTENTDPSLGQVGILAAALYLMHSAAALAAVLPYDAGVSRDVLLRWAARVSGVTAAGVGVGLAGMAVLGRLPSDRSAVGPMVGAVVAALLVGVLTLQLRRR
jgi:hypothetical protein